MQINYALTWIVFELVVFLVYEVSYEKCESYTNRKDTTFVYGLIMLMKGWQSLLGAVLSFKKSYI